MKLEFSQNKAGSHECEGEQQGDWVIYRCAHCPSYERRHNLKTGEMKIQSGDDPMVLHRGTFRALDPAMLGGSLN